MVCGERHDLITLAQKKWISLHHEGAAMLLDEGCKGLIELVFGSCLKDNQFFSQGLCGRLGIARIQTRHSIIWIYKKSDAVGSRDELAQYF